MPVSKRYISTHYRPAMTFDEIGEVLGLTRERVRQIYEEALRKIRKRLRRHPEEADALWSLLYGSPDPTGHTKYKSTEGNCDYYEDSD